MSKYRTESRFRNVWSQILRNEEFEIQPIESGSTGNGVPDAYFSSYKYNMKGWIELKNMDELKDMNRIDFRPGQLSWLKRFYKAGSMCVLGVAFNQGVVYFANADIKEVYSRAEIEARIHPKLYASDFIYDIRSYNENVL
jgi:hypothetical protein